MPAPPSLTERVRSAALGSHVLAAGFIKGDPVFALADGGVLFGLESASAARPHPAGMLSALVAKDAVLSGGEDGRVVRTDADGALLAELWRREGILTVDIDPERALQLRAKNPWYRGRRPELYR